MTEPTTLVTATITVPRADRAGFDVIMACLLLDGDGYYRAEARLTDLDSGRAMPVTWVRVIAWPHDDSCRGASHWYVDRGAGETVCGPPGVLLQVDRAHALRTAAEAIARFAPGGGS